MPVKHYGLVGAYLIDTLMGLCVLEHDSLQFNHVGFTHWQSKIGIVDYDYMSEP